LKQNRLNINPGERYNRWTVIEGLGYSKWLCKCDCGVIKEVRGTALKQGASKSCGCLQRELVTKRATKHGKHETRLYKTWQNMKSRCNNPNASKYYLYGGKGIKVCEGWENDFNAFYNWSLENGYSDKLTLDRIDGNKDYSPGNCRWVTYKVQGNNTTQNHLITYEGTTLTAAQWAEKLGMNYNTFTERLRRGWSIERAITTPTMRIKNFGNYIKGLKKNNVI